MSKVVNIGIFNTLSKFESKKIELQSLVLEDRTDPPPPPPT